MNDFIFDLITDGEFWGVPEYWFTDKLKRYKDIINIEINNSEELETYLKDWIEKHKFSNIENSIIEYDLEKRILVRKAVYTLDGKYWRIIYYEYAYNEYDLQEFPVEVTPVKKVITEYIPIKNN